MNRREFTKSGLATVGEAALGSMDRVAASEAKATQVPVGGKAKSIIFLWLGGGMCHVDTFDPKRMGDVKANKPGSVS